MTHVVLLRLPRLKFKQWVKLTMRGLYISYTNKDKKTVNTGMKEGNSLLFIHKRMHALNVENYTSCSNVQHME